MTHALDNESLSLLPLSTSMCLPVKGQRGVSENRWVLYRNSFVNYCLWGLRHLRSFSPSP